MKLITTNESRIDEWETYFKTVSANHQKALLKVDTRIEDSNALKNLTTKVELLDAQGKQVATGQQKINQQGAASFNLEVTNPHLWDIDTPYLYTLKTTLLKGKKAIDQTTTKVGIRTIDVRQGIWFPPQRQEFEIQRRLSSPRL